RSRIAADRCPHIVADESLGHLNLKDSAPHLVELDTLEQCLEIALAEALVALALDDLEEDRADDVLGEDLQQKALAFGRSPVHQDLALLELLDLLIMAFDALGQELVIGVGSILKLDPALPDDIHRLVDVRGSKRDVLDPLTLILAQELLDLALVVLAFIERY